MIKKITKGRVPEGKRPALVIMVRARLFDGCVIAFGSCEPGNGFSHRLFPLDEIILLGLELGDFFDNHFPQTDDETLHSVGFA